MTSRPQPFLRYGPAALMTVLIPALSLLPARFFRHMAGTHPIPGMDKLVHALLYAALEATLVYALSEAARLRYSCAFRIALAAAVYGVVMEVAQKLLTHSRSCDPLDALANALGAFAVAFLACALARRRAQQSHG